MLAETGSSYAAAEKLFISQSSLVRHIQALEEEFEVPLFDRGRRDFALNANGKIVDLIIEFKKAYPDYVIDYRKSEDMETDLRRLLILVHRCRDNCCMKQAGFGDNNQNRLFFLLKTIKLTIHFLKHAEGGIKDPENDGMKKILNIFSL